MNSFVCFKFTTMRLSCQIKKGHEIMTGGQ
jgi:hypothetical protein